MKNEADIKIGDTSDFDLYVSTSFYDKLSLEMYDWAFHFSDQPYILNKDGSKDIISTIFYLVNCIQEYNADNAHKDSYGRFKKEASLQYHFNICEHNFVQQLIDELLQQLNITNGIKRKSKVYFSHDIDFISSGIKQEFTHSIKKGKISQALNHASNYLRGVSPWDNIDELAKLDNQLNIPSTFYWIGYEEKGRFDIENADYQLKESYLSVVEQRGCTNGLHKSTCTYSYRKEVGDFPIPVRHNRNHFLLNNLPYMWEEMERQAVVTDASLGYSRGLGFRNSYGLPFYPFNQKLEIPYRVLSIPLQVMDVGLVSYGSHDRHQVVKEVMDFINSNRYDCLISLLFHNNELTPFSNKYMLEAYKDIIDILKEERIDIIGVEDILNEFG